MASNTIWELRIYAQHFHITLYTGVDF